MIFQMLMPCSWYSPASASLVRIERALEPDLSVLGTVAPVIIMRRLGGFVELDGRADLDRLLDRLNIAEAPCARLSFYMGRDQS